MFPFLSRRAALAGLLLTAVPAAAQTVPSVTQAVPVVAQPAHALSALRAVPVPPKAAPAVDPQVTDLLKQAVAAHKALQSLTATLTVSAMQNGKAHSRTITLAYLKPGLAKFAVAGDPDESMQVFSNGKSVTTYKAGSKTYEVQPVSPGADALPRVLAQSGALLSLIIARPEVLNSLLTQPRVAAALGSSSTYTLVPVDTITVTLPASGGTKATLTFDIGKADHLLRRVTEHAVIPAQSKVQTITLIETVTALSTAPTLTAADFVFAPPPRTIKITAPQAAQAPLMHDPRLVVGAMPFAVSAKDLNGRPLSLAQYKGKVVLMDFWATWCGPCVGEMPNVIAAYKKYHAQGFEIVGVSLDQSRPALTGFIAENKMPWRQVFDGKAWGSAVPREYGVQSIPFGLLIGRDGKIAAVDVRGPALTAAIQQALAK